MNVFKVLKSGILCRIELKKRQQRWRDKNKDNYTSLGINTTCPFDVIEVGKSTYGPINLHWFCDKKERLKIGNFCSIANGVLFLTGGNHHLKTLSTYPFDHYYKNGYVYYAPTKGPIVVEDDVWIGMNAMILSGVTIGQGAVIGAGSVVAKDVPPYAIYAGNKVVKYRFSKEIIDKLIKFDYSKLTEQDIKENHQLLVDEIDQSFFESNFYKSHLKK